MSDFDFTDACSTGKCNHEDGMCAECSAHMAKEEAYFGALYRREKKLGGFDPETRCEECKGPLDSELRCRPCTAERLMDAADDARKRLREGSLG